MSTVRTGNMRLALESLATNKGRSFMTMLGIIIGVLSVIVAVSIGEGVKQQIGQQVARFGQDVIVVQPGTPQKHVLAGDGLPGGSSLLLTEADFNAVKQTPGITTAAPLSTISGSIKGDTEINNPLIVSTTAGFDKIAKQGFEYGAFFDENSDVQQAVLGPQIAHKLFNDGAPLGQTFSLRGKDFMVTGVFKSFTAPPLSLEANFNEAVFIPYASAQSITATNPGMYQILAKVDTSSHKPADTAKTLHDKLVANHGGADDVRVTAAGSVRGGSDNTLDLVKLMTIGVALIAFLVGGVGIMNIMLVSVTERIHEIGLRKAIGATNRQILDQFMTEAFILSAVGAMIGVVLSMTVILMLRFYTSLHPVFAWDMIIVTPVVAILSGLFFGTFPALQAARKDPIEALRHE